MAVNLQPPATLLPIAGVRVGSACADVKGTGGTRPDVAVFSFSEGTDIGGAFTQSHFAAAPVLLSRARNGRARAWVINSGNANAATGDEGRTDADEICGQTARLLGLSTDQVQPFSTGVIGERLPVERINRAVEVCYADLSEDGWMAAAEAIMTTDTVRKGLSVEVELGGQKISITGIAKGAGMIRPNMATMLAYLATDARVSSGVADMLIQDALAVSFNRITVDGDTSTNDCFMLACTSNADHEEITGREHPLYAGLLAGVQSVARLLAQSLVRDGEGATKFVTVKVTGAASQDDALAVAYTVAESPLVKTALFAGDPNWGRFCMAIGRAPISELDTTGVALWLDDVQVADGGLVSATYSESAGAQVLERDEFSVHIDLGAGDAEETVWTTDLSYEYVRINAEYRT